MKHSDFSIGTQFICGETLWRCTDVGTRVIVAIALDIYSNDESWLNGPPYAVQEVVFDENDMPACKEVHNG